MAPYKKLFQFRIRHEYYRDGVCRDFTITPSESSLEFIGKSGIVSRVEQGMVSYYYDTDSSAYLIDSLADEELKLVFKFYSTDPFFQVFTDYGKTKHDSVLFYDVTDEPAELLVNLHNGNVAGANSLCSLSDSKLTGLLSSHERLVPPVAVVAISIASLAHVLNDDAIDGPFQTFSLCFASRRALWCYFLVGRSEDHDSVPFVKDASGEVSFSEPEPVTMPDGNAAILQKPQTALPLFEVSPYRFQIVRQTQHAQKVLMKNIPVANPRSIDWDEDANISKSNIYIYY